MAKFKPGDKIECLIKEGLVVKTVDDYDAILAFEIIAVGEYGYYLYVPQYYTIKNTVIINEARCRRHDIETRFLWERMTHVTESYIYRVVSEMDGMRCKVCRDFVLMAAPNRKDGAMICYSCRQSSYP